MRAQTPRHTKILWDGQISISQHKAKISQFFIICASKSCKNMQKCKKADFGQRLECPTPKCWSKYTTLCHQGGELAHPSLANSYTVQILAFPIEKLVPHFSDSDAMCTYIQSNDYGVVQKSQLCSMAWTQHHLL